MKLRYDFVIKEVAGKKIAVAVGKDHMAFDGMINLNETAAFLFEQLTNDVSKETLTCKLTENFEVDNDTAKKAVDSFLIKLAESGMITE